MTATTQIVYLFDPLCGWCYGASPMLAELVARPEFDVALVPTGLFAGAAGRPMDEGFAAYAWSNDQRISRLTGQAFSEAYRRDVLADRTRLFDSGPATLALTAVALATPKREFEALQAIQKARYVAGRDVTDIAILGDVLRGLSLSEAADRLTARDADLIDADRKRIEAGRRDMRRFGADGVPALLVGAGDRRRLVRANGLLGRFEDLAAELQAA